MSQFGLLIDFRYCSGCKTCEVSCRQVHCFEPSKSGIMVITQGPVPLAFGKIQHNFIPTPTDLCDYCSNRAAEGKGPSCAENCPVGCIKFGEINDLIEDMTDNRMALFTVK